ncbi:SMC-Scp complex subunit ScpB [Sandaracinobacter sp. RS1-74]|uniref:SMC-Scp complex subunit ScpB n=1 Tax=Sandaracinobacteroides sayramensis TaxID=2913411 RepID=UPI001EDA3F67|nr:SMC-Scp complex subunit ScpB [Sandaracinobacteroides sayramensis]MCG2839783.1 SMC-Scp complex subunit ScpB [Sandaracinobacteroides sayramensis]
MSTEPPTEEPLPSRAGAGLGATRKPNAPADQIPPDSYTRRVESVLFAAAEPLLPSDIRAYAGEGDLGAALETLVADYAPRGVNLVQRGGRWLFQTAPDCASVLERAREVPKKLGRAALETLAIISYHEPVTRADIEEIRGVQTARGTLDSLMEAGFVRPAGRRETPGRPMQYATTPAFLAHFGLETRRDLPGLAELKAAGLLDPLPEESSAFPPAEPQESESGENGPL